jgi:hypothetical protein
MKNMRKNKKSKYKHIVINRKKYYFYKITWVDITGDAGHATAEEFDKFDASTMTTMGYVYSKNRKFLKRLLVMITKMKYLVIEISILLGVY